ncbi:hypothetical protein LJJ48_004518 [Salmonella enterica]|nr:hypothetical protein [Salmonella enterica]
MLTQNESCLDNIACVAPPFGQFSTFIGWFLIAESILTACAGVYFLRKNKKRWSRHDTVMFLFASGLAIFSTWMLEHQWVRTSLDSFVGSYTYRLD